MDEYHGHWIETYTGKKFHFLEPEPEEICIEDIAHALAMTCRFNGHVKDFYSVAEHSVRVAGILTIENQLYGLLHDAAEAYVMDIPRPIKHCYKLQFIEEPVTFAIFKKYGLKLPLPSEVLKADEILLATEGRDLMNNVRDWKSLPDPMPGKLCPWRWDIAETAFLGLAELLGVTK